MDPSRRGIKRQKKQSKTKGHKKSHYLHSMGFCHTSWRKREGSNLETSRRVNNLDSLASFVGVAGRRAGRRNRTILVVGVISNGVVRVGGAATSVGSKQATVGGRGS